MQLNKYQIICPVTYQKAKNRSPITLANTIFGAKKLRTVLG